MNINMVINKRGISPIIATVLILLITFVAISILAVFVVPFVSESLEGSEECFDILGHVTFDESPYNCNIGGTLGDGSEGERTGFSVRVGGEDISGLKIALYNEGSSEVVEFLNGTIGNTLSSKLRMLNGLFSEGLEMPKKGGVRTYVAEGLFEKIEVSARLKSGKTCDLSDSIELNTCLDNDAVSKILAS
ncbi:hypothetical protein COU60_03120 [Candidatus Pacearchaeota archaeon CG10_big_fil_rev_8_21_14_0_10_34_76]|nr:MAG: hypothetical protein COU60_03120 [Candidatus Pacearchaeota archaeon CG10_big_fil_rev_8_21_14_0_10_34_76]